MAIRLIPKRLVGQTIRGIRNRLGQTHEQFAEAVGVSDGSVVENWEEGRTQPEAGTLAKIAAMGLVDVLVFHDDTPSGELPQLTPGEASELRGILARMEALLAEARDIVDAAAGRTVVELLEATAGRAPAPTDLEADGALTLAAEVTVKPRARSAGGSSSSGGSKSGGSKSSSRSGGSKSSSPGGSSRSSSSTSGSNSSSGP
ncbi:MAG TPA: helix-turn-helix transcriptional regulator, partial [Longimicrobium sp.]|nr:helix-turn-helix transcriptional regulator [Longimicrobium sp.]